MTPRRTISYGGLGAAIRRSLAAFDEAGASPGDRVLILTRHEPDAVAAFMAALLDGLVPVMLSPATPDPRAAAVRRSVEPRVVIADAERGARPWADDALLIETQDQTSKGWFGFGKSSDADGFNLALPPGIRDPKLPDDPEGLAYILFTSGTTSAPSGVMLSRRSVLSNLATVSRLFGHTPDSRIYNDLSFGHADGMAGGLLLASFNGAALIRPDSFSVPTIEDWLNGVRRHRATHIISVPAIWAMIDRYADHDDYFDAAECRALVSSAAKLDPALWDRIEQRFNCPLFNIYGLTETVSTALYAGSLPEMGSRGTVGLPVDCEARLRSLSGDALSETETEGEIQLRGSNVFSGYWNEPERSAASFTDDGWMRTGDLARRLDDGSYDIVGRIKSVILTGGFLVLPEEIDEALLTHPAVAEAATVAVDAPDLDEVPISAVVLDGVATEADLTAHCFTVLEPHKVPKRIFAVDAIPRGDAGKPNQAALRSLLLSKMDQPDASAEKDNVLDGVLNLAAKVFREPRAGLTASTTHEEVAGWDSFTSISLVLAAEREFGKKLDTARIAQIQCLGDLADAMN